jgi:hypothetical protein
VPFGEFKLCIFYTDVVHNVRIVYDVQSGKQTENPPPASGYLLREPLQILFFSSVSKAAPNST